MPRFRKTGFCGKARLERFSPLLPHFYPTLPSVSGWLPVVIAEVLCYPGGNGWTVRGTIPAVCPAGSVFKVNYWIFSVDGEPLDYCILVFHVHYSKKMGFRPSPHFLCSIAAMRDKKKQAYKYSFTLLSIRLLFSPPHNTPSPPPNLKPRL